MYKAFVYYNYQSLVCSLNPIIYILYLISLTTYTLLDKERLDVHVRFGALAASAACFASSVIDQSTASEYIHDIAEG